MPKPKPEFAATVKRLAIKAMFSDDELMDRLVLKGGNLLDVVYGVSMRASVDLDFSVDGELGEPESLKLRLARVLVSTFAEAGYAVFDINVRAVPPNLSADMDDFWGGYQVDFKIIERGKFQEF